MTSSVPDQTTKPNQSGSGNCRALLDAVHSYGLDPEVCYWAWDPMPVGIQAGDIEPFAGPLLPVGGGTDKRFPGFPLDLPGAIDGMPFFEAALYWHVNNNQTVVALTVSALRPGLYQWWFDRYEKGAHVMPAIPRADLRMFGHIGEARDGVELSIGKQGRSWLGPAGDQNATKKVTR